MLPGDYEGWYKRHERLIRLLGLSWQEAGFLRAEIDSLSRDLRHFFRKTAGYLLAGFGLLVVLSLVHVVVIQDTVKLLWLVAYFLGLLGSFIASYGFLFYVKGLAPRKEKPQTPSTLLLMTTVPRSVEDLARHTAGLAERTAALFNAGIQERWHQARLELRHQISLAIGFVLIAVSFTIQLSLQFVT